MFCHQTIAWSSESADITNTPPDKDIISRQVHQVTSEGAWCWFADPRALHYENKSGTIHKTYIGYIDIHGNIKAMQYDFKEKKQEEILIRSYFQPDDHNNPTFLVLPDERIMIFYSRHTDEACFYYISKEETDIIRSTENPNARFPRLTYGFNANNNQNSTFWLADGRYIRLKNVDVSYRFTNDWLKRRVGVEGATISLVGENLHVWDKVKLFDPTQASSNGAVYPLQRMYTIQLNLTF